MQGLPVWESVPLLLILLGVLVVVHELGHFLAARWRGLKIDRFAIWFGKPIWKKRINGVEYAMVEDFGSSEKKEPHRKYFHHFENGKCYEYGLGLGTVDDNLAGLKPVNRSLVFGRLEQILASVKLQPVAVPEVAQDVQAHPMVEGSKQ